MVAQAAATRVLIVHDDEEIGALLAVLCEDLDLRSYVAGDRQEARDALRRHPWRLIITGALAHPAEPWVWIDECQALLHSPRGAAPASPAPILLISTYSKAVLARHEAHGVAAVLHAPFDVDDLADRLTTLVGPVG